VNGVRMAAVVDCAQHNGQVVHGGLRYLRGAGSGSLGVAGADKTDFVVVLVGRDPPPPE
jgi:hypothetical protein